MLKHPLPGRVRVWRSSESHFWPNQINMFQQLQSTSARSTFQQLLPKPVNIQLVFQKLEGNPSTSKINSCRLPNQLFRRSLHIYLVNIAGSGYGQQGPTAGSADGGVRHGGVRRRGVAAGPAWLALGSGIRVWHRDGVRPRGAALLCDAHVSVAPRRSVVRSRSTRLP